MIITIAPLPAFSAEHGGMLHLCHAVWPHYDFEIMKKPYFSMIGAVICGAIMFQFVMALFFDGPSDSDSVTKWDGIIEVWFFVYLTPVVIGFLLFTWRVRNFYKVEQRDVKKDGL